MFISRNSWANSEKCHSFLANNELWTMGGVEQGAPHGGSFFLDMTSRGSECGRWQKRTALDGSAWKAGRPAIWNSVYRLGLGEVSHCQSMFPGCLCSPLSGKQCCHDASNPLQMHKDLYSKIFPRTALCRQCSCPSLSRSPLGPITCSPQSNCIRIKVLV